MLDAPTNLNAHSSQDRPACLHGLVLEGVGLHVRATEHFRVGRDGQRLFSKGRPVVWLVLIFLCWSPSTKNTAKYGLKIGFFGENQGQDVRYTSKLAVLPVII